MTNSTEPDQPKRPFVIWLSAVFAFLIASMALIFFVLGSLRMPGYVADHPIRMIVLPLAKISLVMATGIALLRRYPPSRWLAACGYLAYAIMNVFMLFRHDSGKGGHALADLSGISRSDPFYVAGQAIGRVLMCLILISLSGWMIHRLLFHPGVLLYFGIKRSKACPRPPTE